MRLFDDPELIELLVEDPTSKICGGSSTPETRARYASLKAKPSGSTWQEGDYIYKR
jgi:hypothetical protein